ncbi:hypothetical protein Tco_0534532 [Tanacetum coccineum]
MLTTKKYICDSNLCEKVATLEAAPPYNCTEETYSSKAIPLAFCFNPAFICRLDIFLGFSWERKAAKQNRTADLGSLEFDLLDDLMKCLSVEIRKHLWWHQLLVEIRTAPQSHQS